MTKLIKAREAVYGRRATAAECKRFREFAKFYAKAMEEAAKDDAEFLAKVIEYLNEHGHFPTSREVLR